MKRSDLNRTSTVVLTAEALTAIEAELPRYVSPSIFVGRVVYGDLRYSNIKQSTRLTALGSALNRSGCHSQRLVNRNYCRVRVPPVRRLFCERNAAIEQ